LRNSLTVGSISLSNKHIKISNNTNFNNITAIMELENPKVFCEKCLFWINPVDHDKRCGGRGRGVEGNRLLPHEDWTSRRRAAWMNDAILMADIRIAALYMGIAGPLLNDFQVKYTSNKALADYYDKFADKSLLLTPVSQQAHAKATVIEAMYHSGFRLKYLVHFFGDLGRKINDMHTPPVVFCTPRLSPEE
jgi:hypothetical protein